MRNLLAALGLVFAIEGLLLAGFPALMRRALASAATREPMQLRMLGLASAVVGVILVWLARRAGL